MAIKRFETAIKLILVEQSDDEHMTQVQKLLNQWNTIGKLIKYEIHASGQSFLFNICYLKNHK